MGSLDRIIESCFCAGVSSEYTRSLPTEQRQEHQVSSKVYSVTVIFISYVTPYLDLYYDIFKNYFNIFFPKLFIACQ